MEGGESSRERRLVDCYGSQRYGQSSVHLVSFLYVLINLVPGEVTRFAKKIEMVIYKGRKVELTFQDGAEADAVISVVKGSNQGRNMLYSVQIQPKNQNLLTSMHIEH